MFARLRRHNVFFSALLSQRIISSVMASAPVSMGNDQCKMAPSLEAALGESATFGAGCYWGTEKFFRKDFQKQFPGALTYTAVGFMGPPSARPNPSYEQVCSGTTGHVEVLHLKFDPAKVSYEDLVKFFYSFHDPTTANRQGNDRGTQYASAIFYHSDEQRAVAERVTGDLQARLASSSLKFSGRPFAEAAISTGILQATQFYAAEEYHQQYLEKNANGYCNHGIRFKWSDQ